MNGILRLAAAAAAVLCAAAMQAGPAEAAGPGAEARVLEARISEGRGGFALDLTLSGQVPFRVFSLDMPPRVVVDFARLDWEAAPPLPRPGGLVAGLRYGLLDASRTRIVLDLSRPARVEEAAFRDGARFGLTLRPEDPTAFAAASGWPEGARPAPARPPHAPPDGRLTVVIDPGHGGVDPGAIRDGVMEKDLALAFALDLKAAFEAQGRRRVVMTRDDDTYVGLRERVRIGAEAGGDVFLSIHVNTVEVGDARGASIHTLSDTATDAEAAELAAFENRADILAGVDLEGQGDDVARALIDLAQRRANGASRRLATALVEALAPSRRCCGGGRGAPPASGC